MTQVSHMFLSQVESDRLLCQNSVTILLLTPTPTETSLPLKLNLRETATLNKSLLR
ncbi:hypothetical protein [Chroococcidiopsis sp. CCNUC1]|uniref:hypothetical protein n=1 Tax=Chroococcidiopsis sp. CCNUC1 TaxID=2653189 RepID=UPI002021EDB7|nr:hypothetical protein [Chroococcidiopsis sp. CCNUC1]URD50259.1 hypothetical protein M5J74_28660 [Chroococcidiopsis sp. CCNUC1]